MANTVSRMLSDDTLNRIIQIESAGKPHARAGTSSAAGLGQFITATWLGTVKKHRPELLRQHPQADVVAMRVGPTTTALQLEMLARFTEDNARALGAGFRDGDLYLAHFLGLGDARKLFRADPGTMAASVVTAAAVRANQSILAGKTCGEVRAWAQRSMEQRWDKAGRPDWVKQYAGKGPKPAEQPAALPVPPATPTTKQDAKEVGWLSGIVTAITGFLYVLWGNWAFRALLFLAVAVALWWFVVRPIVRRYWALDEIETDVLTRLRLALKGVKTKLFSMLLGIAGIALPVLSYAEGFDLAAFLPDIFGIPASIYQYGILALIGWATNALRNATTTPVGQTDMALATVEAPPIAPETSQDFRDRVDRISGRLPPAEEIVKATRHKRPAKKAKRKKRPRAKA
jgi:hypothetical protein